MKRRTFLAAASLIIMPIPALAHSYKLGDIAIGHAWALPSHGIDCQAFFPLVNNGKTSDALVAARSGVSGLIELRQNNRYDDPPLKSIALEPGIPVPMRPTARHLRLVGLTKPLAIDDRFSLILDFLNAGEIEIEAVVEARPGG